MSSDQKAILAGICVTVMLGVLFTNLIVTNLFKTNQTGTPYNIDVEFSDVLLALIALPTLIFGTITKTDSHVLQIASPFLTL